MSGWFIFKSPLELITAGVVLSAQNYNTKALFLLITI